MWLLFMNTLKKMLGCFNPTFGSNMDKPKCWVRNAIKNVQLKVEVGLKFEITQHLGLSIFYPNLG